MPIDEPAPALFSTITDWPSRGVRCSAVSRPSRSLPAPGRNGTTIFTGPAFGYSCASAGLQTTSAAASDATSGFHLMFSSFVPCAIGGAPPSRVLGKHRLHGHGGSAAAARDGGEHERARLHVLLDARLHRLAALAPARELLDQPVVDPLRLHDRRDLLSRALAVLLAPEVLPHEHLDVAVREDRGAALAIDADVLLVKRVEADGMRDRPFVRGAHAVLERHRHDRIGVAAILRPRGLPGRRVERFALRAGEVGDDVEVMDRAFDEQRIVHLVTKARAPRHELAHVALEAHADRVDAAEDARSNDTAQRGLVLVEAVAHRHGHLPPRARDIACDAQ